jgi:hypothetical protein
MYYPEAAPTAIRARLSAPVYDVGAVREFMRRTLEPAEPGARKTLMDQAILANGVAFRDGLIAELWSSHTRQADEILEQLIGNTDSTNPPILNSASTEEIGWFISWIDDVDSAEITEAIWNTFTKYGLGQSETWDGFDEIAVRAARWLVHKGHDSELLAFCNRRSGELRRSNSDDYNRSYFDKLREQLSSSISHSK